MKGERDRRQKGEGRWRDSVENEEDMKNRKSDVVRKVQGKGG